MIVEFGISIVIGFVIVVVGSYTGAKMALNTFLVGISTLPRLINFLQKDLPRTTRADAYISCTERLRV